MSAMSEFSLLPYKPSFIGELPEWLFENKALYIDPNIFFNIDFENEGGGCLPDPDELERYKQEQLRKIEGKLLEWRYDSHEGAENKANELLCGRTDVGYYILKNGLIISRVEILAPIPEIKPPEPFNLSSFLSSVNWRGLIALLSTTGIGLYIYTTWLATMVALSIILCIYFTTIHGNDNGAFEHYIPIAIVVVVTLIIAA